eukprot:CAMPEP_0205998034 /NCGR_PEP_ID=MMETSP1464-20131121/4_1 /ASSEMBLY_ACC=CAM_ASM_001124 /TAXON_ID=119497 /ORGANISM="Exanthemachrysis gayraliae, Strain RCC1523" /LENGTH=35 /DNA_ID= /DNA_START= /DNA_END= /DNA_ORIENTATION=
MTCVEHRTLLPNILEIVARYILDAFEGGVVAGVAP